MSIDKYRDQIDTPEIGKSVLAMVREELALDENEPLDVDTPLQKLQFETMDALGLAFKLNRRFDLNIAMDDIDMDGNIFNIVLLVKSELDARRI